jgi:hypothetical protein
MSIDRIASLNLRRVFGDLDRLNRGADELDAVLRQDASLLGLDGEVERGLAAHRRKNRVGPLAFQDALEDLHRERLDIGPVGQLGIGHDRRRIAVDENHLEPLVAQRLARLRARVVEFAGLADDNRAGADDEDAFQIAASWH